MRLWILRPTRNEKGEWHPTWTPWYDKAQGFVIFAETEMDARNFASAQAGDEGGVAWLDEEQSMILDLGAMIEDTTDAGVIMVDFASA